MCAKVLERGISSLIWRKIFRIVLQVGGAEGAGSGESAADKISRNRGAEKPEGLQRIKCRTQPVIKIMGVEIFKVWSGRAIGRQFTRSELQVTDDCLFNVD